MAALPELCIRPARRSDLEAVARVWHESASSMDGSPPVPPIADMRRRIDDELASGWDLHVAIRDERIIGMLALNLAEARLDQIFVLPSEQGTGVGRALIEAAKKRMPAGFRLRMAAANEAAAAFYRKAGFATVGEGFHPSSGVPVRFLGWTPGKI